MEEVKRYDMHTIGNAVRTPQGGLMIPATLTRVGIFTYRFPDGTARREFRPPEEVFNEDSLATLRNATVTDLHPPEMVRPANFRKYAIGHVKEDVKKADDDRHVEASLIVQDGETINKIDRKERKELSCGYVCKIDSTPGEYNGESYDVVQRSIRYNHVALGPSNWGRAGNSVALRLDSGDAVTCDNDEPISIKVQSNILEDKPMKIRFDGKEYEAGSKEHLDAVDAKHATEFATLKSENDKLQGRCDALATDLENANKKITALDDPARLATAVAARVDLVSKAGKVLGAAYKFDSKTDQEIMIDTIKKLDSGFVSEGKSADYIRGMFDTRVSAPRTDSKSVAAALAAAGSAGAGPGATEGEARIDASEKRKEMIKHNRSLSSEPMTLSKV